MGFWSPQLADTVVWSQYYTETSGFTSAATQNFHILKFPQSSYNGKDNELVKYKERKQKKPIKSSLQKKGSFRVKSVKPSGRVLIWHTHRPGFELQHQTEGRTLIAIPAINPSTLIMWSIYPSSSASWSPMTWVNSCNLGYPSYEIPPHCCILLSVAVLPVWPQVVPLMVLPSLSWCCAKESKTQAIVRKIVIWQLGPNSLLLSSSSSERWTLFHLIFWTTTTKISVFTIQCTFSDYAV